METLIIILVLGVVGYFIVTQTSSPTSTNTPLTTSNIPETALDKFYDDIRDKFVNGEMAVKFDTSIILKKDEKLIFDIPGITLCEERTVKTKGSHQGFSIRVMKGVSYRFGDFEAAPQKEVVELDVGNLTLTNKRLMFSGSTNSVDYPISKINRIEAMETGISISRAGKVRVEYFLGTSNVSLTGTVSPDEGESFEPEEITYEFSGHECKTVLTTLVQESE
jgi:hypothetical protein|tara:strand:- start:397 stop:1059 length:663 start_codon:yes stop_codon:yes gene_type:complete